MYTYLSCSAFPDSLSNAFSMQGPRQFQYGSQEGWNHSREFLRRKFIIVLTLLC